MNIDPEHHQQRPRAAVVADGDNDNDNFNDEENLSDIDVDNDAEADAAVNRSLRALFDRMQKGTIRGDRSIASAGKLGSILLQRQEFPYRQRKKNRALVTEFLSNLERNEEIWSQSQHPAASNTDTSREPVQTFLNDLRRDISDMLCDQSHDTDMYRGLDSNRDTEEEVITAIRFFPENLTARGGMRDELPIMCVQVLKNADGLELSLNNTKAVFFVHVLAKLAIELNSFEEDERGGLLIQNTYTGRHTLQFLVRTNAGGDEDYHRHADIVFLEELTRLYQMDLFKQEDIQRYSLVTESCKEKAKYFPEKRFRFLVQMDPHSLFMGRISKRHIMGRISNRIRCRYEIFSVPEWNHFIIPKERGWADTIPICVW